MADVTPIQIYFPERPSVDELVDEAMDTYRRLIDEGEALHFACSYGKDSWTVLNLGLMALKAAKIEGRNVPPVYVVTSDTLIENPEIHSYVLRMQAKVREFAKENDLPIHVETVSPSLASSWAVSILGGRKLPQFASRATRDCSTDWKKEPAQKLVRKIRKELQDQGMNIVTVTGTRFSESQVRGRKMRERGDSALDIREQEDGSRTLSVIADWTTDDVWEYLAMAGNHGYRQFPAALDDFQETIDIYRDATGECQIVAETKGSQSSACGARFGCHNCCVTASDKSMETMIDQPKYAYMKGLNDLRNYMTDTQADLTKRRWIGNDIERTGYIWIGPNCYGPEMLENLLKWSLTIDAREQEEAYRLSIEPRFQLISPEALIAIDMIWARDHLFPKPYHALAIYDEIFNQGKRFDIPRVMKVTQEQKDLFATPEYQEWKKTQDFVEPLLVEYVVDQTVPPKRWLSVGMYDMEGRDQLVDYVSLGLAGQESCGVEDINTGNVFDINSDAANLILELELPNLLKRRNNGTSNPTTAFHYYNHIGVVIWAKGKLPQQQHLLNRGQFFMRLGLAGSVDPATIMSRTISNKEHQQIAVRMGIELNDDKREAIVSAKWGREPVDQRALDNALRQEFVSRFEANQVVSECGWDGIFFECIKIKIPNVDEKLADWCINTLPTLDSSIEIVRDADHAIEVRCRFADIGYGRLAPLPDERSIARVNEAVTATQEKLLAMIGQQAEIEQSYANFNTRKVAGIGM